MNARTYRVRVYFLGRDGELLAISSRLVSYSTARKLTERLKGARLATSRDEHGSPQLSLCMPAVRVSEAAVPYDVLDAEMYTTKNPKPLQDGVRQILRLDEEGLERSPALEPVRGV